MISDVTYRRYLRDPLALINCLEDAILLLDKKNRVVFINKTGEELIGKNSNELTGRQLGELFPEALHIVELARKAISEARSFSAKEVEAKFNTTVKVDFHISPFFIEDTCEGVLLSIRENLSIVEKEDSSFDALVYLLGSIAHEIKNPLGGIKGAAQLLNERLSDGEAHSKSSSGIYAGSKEYIDLIIRETDRLNSILQGYLTISKKPLLHSINIHEVLEKAVSIMNLSVESVKITLQRLYDPSLPRVTGDEGKLLQVFLNIIKNAVEAMPKGGLLVILTRPSAEYVVQNGRPKRWAVVAVSDTGEGILRNELQKIFLPFYTSKKKGTGLGLALSKKIIKDHSGFIKVESPLHNDKGTSFNIYIPFAEEF